MTCSRLLKAVASTPILAGEIFFNYQYALSLIGFADTPWRGSTELHLIRHQSRWVSAA